MGDGRWGKGHFAVTAEYIALNLIKTIFLFFKSIKKKSVISFRSINSSIYPFRFFIQAKYFLIFCILPHSTKDLRQGLLATFIMNRENNDSITGARTNGNCNHDCHSCTLGDRCKFNDYLEKEFMLIDQ